MSEFTRDPQEYEMSVHALQMSRDRNVPVEAVAKCIREGTEVESSKYREGVRVRARYGAIQYWAALAPEDGTVKSCGVVG